MFGVSVAVVAVVVAVVAVVGAAADAVAVAVAGFAVLSSLVPGQVQQRAGQQQADAPDAWLFVFCCFCSFLLLLSRACRLLLCCLFRVFGVAALVIVVAVFAAAAPLFGALFPFLLFLFPSTLSVNVTFFPSLLSFGCGVGGWWWLVGGGGGGGSTAAFHSSCLLREKTLFAVLPTNCVLSMPGRLSD